MEKFIWAFVIGGLICVIGQIIMDVFKAYSCSYYIAH